MIIFTDVLLPDALPETNIPYLSGLATGTENENHVQWLGCLEVASNEKYIKLKTGNENLRKTETFVDAVTEDDPILFFNVVCKSLPQ